MKCCQISRTSLPWLVVLFFKAKHSQGSFASTSHRPVSVSGSLLSERITFAPKSCGRRTVNLLFRKLKYSALFVGSDPNAFIGSSKSIVGPEGSISALWSKLSDELKSSSERSLAELWSKLPDEWSKIPQDLRSYSKQSLENLWAKLPDDVRAFSERPLEDLWAKLPDEWSKLPNGLSSLPNQMLGSSESIDQIWLQLPRDIQVLFDGPIDDMLSRLPEEWSKLPEELRISSELLFEDLWSQLPREIRFPSERSLEELWFKLPAEFRDPAYFSQNFQMSPALGFAAAIPLATLVGAFFVGRQSMIRCDQIRQIIRETNLDLAGAQDELDRQYRLQRNTVGAATLSSVLLASTLMFGNQGMPTQPLTVMQGFVIDQFNSPPRPPQALLAMKGIVTDQFGALPEPLRPQQALGRFEKVFKEMSTTYSSTLRQLEKQAGQQSQQELAEETLALLRKMQMPVDSVANQGHLEKKQQELVQLQNTYVPGRQASVDIMDADEEMFSLTSAPDRTIVSSMIANAMSKVAEESIVTTPTPPGNEGNPDSELQTAQPISLPTLAAETTFVIYGDEADLVAPSTSTSNAQASTDDTFTDAGLALSNAAVVARLDNKLEGAQPLKELKSFEGSWDDDTHLPSVTSSANIDVKGATAVIMEETTGGKGTASDFISQASSEGAVIDLPYKVSTIADATENEDFSIVAETASSVDIGTDDGDASLLVVTSSLDDPGTTLELSREDLTSFGNPSFARANGDSIRSVDHGPTRDALDSTENPSLVKASNDADMHNENPANSAENLPEGITREGDSLTLSPTGKGSAVSAVMEKLEAINKNLWDPVESLAQGKVSTDVVDASSRGATAAVGNGMHTPYDASKILGYGDDDMSSLVLRSAELEQSAESDFSSHGIYGGSSIAEALEELEAMKMDLVTPPGESSKVVTIQGDEYAASPSIPMMSDLGTGSSFDVEKNQDEKADSATSIWSPSVFGPSAEANMLPPNGSTLSDGEEKLDAVSEDAFVPLGGQSGVGSSRVDQDAELADAFASLGTPSAVKTSSEVDGPSRGMGIDFTTVDEADKLEAMRKDLLTPLEGASIFESGHEVEDASLSIVSSRSSTGTNSLDDTSRNLGVLANAISPNWNPSAINRVVENGLPARSVEIGSAMSDGTEKLEVVNQEVFVSPGRYSSVIDNQRDGGIFSPITSPSSMDANTRPGALADTGASFWNPPVVETSPDTDVSRRNGLTAANSIKQRESTSRVLTPHPLEVWTEGEDLYSSTETITSVADATTSGIADAGLGAEQSSPFSSRIDKEMAEGGDIFPEAPAKTNIDSFTADARKTAESTIEDFFTPLEKSADVATTSSATLRGIPDENNDEAHEVSVTAIPRWVDAATQRSSYSTTSEATEKIEDTSALQIPRSERASIRGIIADDLESSLRMTIAEGSGKAYDPTKLAATAVLSSPPGLFGSAEGGPSTMDDHSGSVSTVSDAMKKLEAIRRDMFTAQENPAIMPSSTDPVTFQSPGPVIGSQTARDSATMVDKMVDGASTRLSPNVRGDVDDGRFSSDTQPKRVLTMPDVMKKIEAITTDLFAPHEAPSVALSGEGQVSAQEANWEASTEDRSSSIFKEKVFADGSSTDGNRQPFSSISDAIKKLETTSKEYFSAHDIPTVFEVSNQELVALVDVNVIPSDTRMTEKAVRVSDETEKLAPHLRASALEVSKGSMSVSSKGAIVSTGEEEAPNMKEEETETIAPLSIPSAFTAGTEGDVTARSAAVGPIDGSKIEKELTKKDETAAVAASVQPVAGPTMGKESIKNTETGAVSSDKALTMMRDFLVEKLEDPWIAASAYMPTSDDIWWTFEDLLRSLMYISQNLLLTVEGGTATLRNWLGSMDVRDGVSSLRNWIGILDEQVKMLEADGWLNPTSVAQKVEGEINELRSLLKMLEEQLTAINPARWVNPSFVSDAKESEMGELRNWLGTLKEQLVKLERKGWLISSQAASGEATALRHWFESFEKQLARLEAEGSMAQLPWKEFSFLATGLLAGAAVLSVGRRRMSEGERDENIDLSQTVLRFPWDMTNRAPNSQSANMDDSQNIPIQFPWQASDTPTGNTGFSQNKRRLPWQAPNGAFSFQRDKQNIPRSPWTANDRTANSDRTETSSFSEPVATNYFTPKPKPEPLNGFASQRWAEARGTKSLSSNGTFDAERGQEMPYSETAQRQQVAIDNSISNYGPPPRSAPLNGSASKRWIQTGQSQSEMATAADSTGRSPSLSRSPTLEPFNVLASKTQNWGIQEGAAAPVEPLDVSPRSTVSDDLGRNTGLQASRRKGAPAYTNPTYGLPTKPDPLKALPKGQSASNDSPTNPNRASDLLNGIASKIWQNIASPSTSQKANSVQRSDLWGRADQRQTGRLAAFGEDSVNAESGARRSWQTQFRKPSPGTISLGFSPSSKPDPWKGFGNKLWGSDSNPGIGVQAMPEGLSGVAVPPEKQSEQRDNDWVPSTGGFNDPGRIEYPVTRSDLRPTLQGVADSGIVPAYNIPKPKPEPLNGFASKLWASRNSAVDKPISTPVALDGVATSDRFIGADGQMRLNSDSGTGTSWQLQRRGVENRSMNSNYAQKPKPEPLNGFASKLWTSNSDFADRNDMVDNPLTEARPVQTASNVAIDGRDPRSIDSFSVNTMQVPVGPSAVSSAQQSTLMPSASTSREGEPGKTYYFAGRVSPDQTRSRGESTSTAQEVLSTAEPFRPPTVGVASNKIPVVRVVKSGNADVDLRSRGDEIEIEVWLPDSEISKKSEASTQRASVEGSSPGYQPPAVRPDEASRSTGSLEPNAGYLTQDTDRREARGEFADAFTRARNTVARTLSGVVRDAVGRVVPSVDSMANSGNTPSLEGAQAARVSTSTSQPYPGMEEMPNGTLWSSGSRPRNGSKVSNEADGKVLYFEKGMDSQQSNGKLHSADSFSNGKILADESNPATSWSEATEQRGSWSDKSNVLDRPYLNDIDRRSPISEVARGEQKRRYLGRLSTSSNALDNSSTEERAPGVGVDPSLNFANGSEISERFNGESSRMPNVETYVLQPDNSFGNGGRKIYAPAKGLERTDFVRNTETSAYFDPLAVRRDQWTAAAAAGETIPFLPENNMSASYSSSRRKML